VVDVESVEWIQPQSHGQQTGGRNTSPQIHKKVNIYRIKIPNLSHILILSQRYPGYFSSSKQQNPSAGFGTELVLREIR